MACPVACKVGGQWIMEIQIQTEIFWGYYQRRDDRLWMFKSLELFFLWKIIPTSPRFLSEIRSFCFSSFTICKTKRKIFNLIVLLWCHSKYFCFIYSWYGKDMLVVSKIVSHIKCYVWKCECRRKLSIDDCKVRIVSNLWLTSGRLHLNQYLVIGSIMAHCYTMKCFCYTYLVLVLMDICCSSCHLIFHNVIYHCYAMKYLSCVNCVFAQCNSIVFASQYHLWCHRLHPWYTMNIPNILPWPWLCLYFCMVLSVAFNGNANISVLIWICFIMSTIHDDVPEPLKLCSCKRLGKEITHHIPSWIVSNLNMSLFGTVSD